MQYQIKAYICITKSNIMTHTVKRKDGRIVNVSIPEKTYFKKNNEGETIEVTGDTEMRLYKLWKTGLWMALAKDIYNQTHSVLLNENY